ncbi:Protein of unknown function (DUF861) [Seminavis robusta]|uniref:(S)-ureidoglycine aminohydrolase cupin domain-containing protein n=1 Tax=Seminavis robusta TaxID=568900 RepID=A0A9N8DM51_9STRA|nr:Protein of unknown function (DUF861) [Seminavis robusta]|eukprot:Sro220_g090850.1 Protein of unknown function (DUF861) (142) ;mRNA; f:88857-89282
MSQDSEAGADIGKSLPMILFRPGMDVGELEDWPFENPKSDYVVHTNEGGKTPRASGRIDSSTPTSRVGIWKCTQGKFECTEQGDELMTILSGVVTVTNIGSGQAVTLKEGDSMFSRDGSRVLWDIQEDVTKVFYGSKPDGY